MLLVWVFKFPLFSDFVQRLHDGQAFVLWHQVALLGVVKKAFGNVVGFELEAATKV